MSLHVFVQCNWLIKCIVNQCYTNVRQQNTCNEHVSKHVSMLRFWLFFRWSVQGLCRGNPDCPKKISYIRRANWHTFSHTCKICLEWDWTWAVRDNLVNKGMFHTTRSPKTPSQVCKELSILMLWAGTRHKNKNAYSGVVQILKLYCIEGEKSTSALNNQTPAVLWFKTNTTRHSLFIIIYVRTTTTIYTQCSIDLSKVLY